MNTIFLYIKIFKNIHLDKILFKSLNNKIYKILKLVTVVGKIKLLKVLV